MAAKEGKKAVIWANAQELTPRKLGWYATQDDTMEGNWYQDSYWDGSGWFTFGKHVTLHVKIEMHGILRWRHMTDSERDLILAEAPDADVPKDAEQQARENGRPLKRRLLLLFLVDKYKPSIAELARRLDMDRKSLDRMRANIPNTTGVRLELKGKQLIIADWGPISKEWVRKHGKDMETH